MKIPVKDAKMVRDSTSRAVLSTDREAVVAYEERVKKIQSDRDRLNRLETEMSVLRALIEELRKK
jgi:hypothetical protein